MSAYDHAVIHLGLDERDAAVALLERRHRERAHWMALLGTEARLDPVRDEPRFRRRLELLHLESARATAA